MDNKKVKTPAGKLLILPSKALAMAVSVEWNSQRETIKPESMHLVRISSMNDSFHGCNKSSNNNLLICGWFYLSISFVLLSCQTSLSNTVIDNPKTKSHKQQMSHILEFLSSDTLW